MDTIHRSKNHSLQHVFERGEDLALHMEKKSIVLGSVTGEPHYWYSIYINQHVIYSLMFEWDEGQTLHKNMVPKSQFIH